MSNTKAAVNCVLYDLMETEIINDFVVDVVSRNDHEIITMAIKHHEDSEFLFHTTVLSKE